jgi:hypothetical protein
MTRSKTLMELLEKTKGTELPRLRLRLKARLKALVERAWVLIEKTSHVSRVAHVRVFLRDGTRRYLVVEAGTGDGSASAPARTYEDVDLRDDQGGPNPLGVKVRAAPRVVTASPARRRRRASWPVRPSP